MQINTLTELYKNGELCDLLDILDKHKVTIIVENKPTNVQADGTHNNFVVEYKIENDKIKSIQYRN